MTFYFPIAEMSLNIFMLLGMGGLVGFLSGMFGVGGGFLMTPLLIFAGVPPAIAVATEANQITAASVSGAMAHWRRGGVDVRMGLMLIAGGIVGTFIGASIFTYLVGQGLIDTLIASVYVVFLSAVGGLMVWESIRDWLRRSRGIQREQDRRNHNSWIYALPFKMRFRKSRLYVSALLPLGLGVIVGILAAIMGVGGGFIMVPVMIYIFGMPTNVVVGTSLFQIIFVTASVTILHSVNTQTVDVLLALVLLSGAVVGAQFGVRAGYKLRGDQVRGLLGLVVLGVGIRLAWSLVVEPSDPFSVNQVLP